MGRGRGELVNSRRVAVRFTVGCLGGCFGTAAREAADIRGVCDKQERGVANLEPGGHPFGIGSAPGGHPTGTGSPGGQPLGTSSESRGDRGLRFPSSAPSRGEAPPRGERGLRGESSALAPFTDFIDDNLSDGICGGNDDDLSAVTCGLSLGLAGIGLSLV